ncbi:NACHT domain-containing protein [Flavobacterium algicola]|uniref:NACHT domain-containing protein n=1 Tax=Flavobacterium algicola TaxID=556529 RepID=UPI001EFCD317|nr:NACHT domain-containing protein [Flavobacterium algicola]MCG9791727.1 NACHT domain-containing protein [Flavobacterium algicola]
MNKQINSLEKLSLSKIKEIILNVLAKEGYKNLISDSTNLINSDTKEGLSTFSTAFYVYQKNLSGSNVELKELQDKIKLAHKSSQPHLMILITGYNISGSVQKNLRKSFEFSFDIIHRETLIELISAHFPNFWMYENFDLVAYEKYFLEDMVEKSALLNIQGLESKAKKLLDIYIKPRIYEIKKDLESNKSQLNKVNEAEIMRRGKSCIIEGDTGSGKSTLLKEIGRLQIQEQKDLKTLPIFISPILLYASNFDIVTAATKLLHGKVEGEWEEILKSYNLTLLIDNIDDFEEGEQKQVIDQLNELNESGSIRYVLSTRSIKAGKISTLCADVNFFQIRKFNDLQIREFAFRFFNNAGITSNLIEALEDNRILQKLPLTPLSLSLIALVYEKENYEIPATISDIYDNFNQLILGKLTATKRFEIIKFNFRERILSLYALEILRHNNGRPYTKSAFLNFLKEYFQDKSSDIAPEVLDDFLSFFIESSGILRMEEEQYVNFSHKSFLEYYASLEIFKHKRELESDLVENFLDLSWQNVALFYGGQSKDMPNFLREILTRIKRGTTVEEHNNAILGLGYLLQALYQTDNKLRREAVDIALDQSLILHEWYKKIIIDGEVFLFKNMSLPALSIFNMYFFYLNFLSSTLNEPLSQAFQGLLEKYKQDNQTNIGYQLLTIAAIFHSKKFGDSSYLKTLFDETKLLKDPYLVTIADFALYFDSGAEHKVMKQQLHQVFLKMSDVTRDLIKLPASKLRFSPLDSIESRKKVTIITEGPTDAEILEHAFTILTDGKIPYWKVKPAGNKSGGANEVKFLLDKSKPLSGENEFIIGIFDHDTEGINQFDGLQFDFYEDFTRVKQMSGANIFGIKLPVPNFREEYVRQERENFYLAIEHYFEDSILIENDLVKASGVPGLYKIKDSSGVKTKFAKKIKLLKNPLDFKNFIPLFETIDKISGIQETDYYAYI